MPMASTPKHVLSENSTDSTTTSKSYFQKTVCLKDWWLVKAEKDFDGKRLAVAGITSGEKQAVRVFFSAPILKIYDVFSLETVDGISVILNGFMNKARTEENGFPSEVCEHFVFGFPPCWEIYARKCLEGESTHSNLNSERLSPQARRRETSCGNSSAESRKNLELSGNHCDNGIAEPLSSLGLEENSAPSSIKGNTNDTGNENYGGKNCSLNNLQDHYTNGSPLSACHLTKERGYTTIVQPLEAPSKVNPIEKLRKRMVFSREAEVLEEVSSNSVAKGTTCSEKKVKGKFKDNQMFHGELENEKIISVSVLQPGSNAVGNARANLEDPSRGISTPNPPDTRFQELTDEMISRNPDAMSFQDNAELDHGISSSVKDSKQVQNHGGVQENGRMKNKTDGYISSSAHSDTGKRKKKIARGEQSNSRCKSVSTRNARRKLAYGSPVSQKEKESSIVSPQSLCLKRSRSGRWLLPSLEFWRNQRAFYDADRQITGIKDLH